MESETAPLVRGDQQFEYRAATRQDPRRCIYKLVVPLSIAGCVLMIAASGPAAAQCSTEMTSSLTHDARVAVASDELGGVQRAIETVRAWRSQDPSRTTTHITVELGEGTHFLRAGESLVLAPEDSHMTLRGNAGTWLSGGQPLSNWSVCDAYTFGSRRAFCAALPSSVRYTSAAPLRNIRVGDDTMTQLRYPASSSWDDYVDGYLFVNETFWPAEYDDTAFFFTVQHSGALPAWLSGNWTGWASLLPDAQWLNYYASVRLASTADRTFLNVSDAILFLVTCPSTRYHACHQSSSELVSGNAFWLFGNSVAPSIETFDGDAWVFDGARQAVVFWPTNGKQPTDGDVIVPTMERIIQVAGNLSVDCIPLKSSDMVTDIEILDLGLIDATFSSTGFQSDFNVFVESEGIPNDAALRISGASGISVRKCRFSSLAGAGVSVANGSFGVSITTSSFHKIGQSAVMFIGNATTQPTSCSIIDNVIERVGLFMFSSAGVFVSTASHMIIARNNISWSPRWGIAVRSEEVTRSASLHNLIEHNRVHHTGLATSDLGAISVIAWSGGPNANTTIRENCVRDVRGMIAEGGTMTTPYNARGLYLDNEASGFLIDGNVFRNAVTTGAFIHGGGNNTLINNVFFNMSNSDDMDGDGAWTYSHPSGSSWLNRSMHNRVELNINVNYNYTGVHAIGCPSWGECTETNNTFDVVDKNVHFRYGVDFKDWASSASLTPFGDWDAWQSAGLDRHSVYANPCFLDVEYNLCLEPGSPAFALGFRRLPSIACEC